MQKKEKIFFVKWAVFIIFLTSLPYFFALVLQNKNFKYAGYSTANSADINTYLAWSYQAKKNILFKDNYTTEPHKRIFFHPFFLLIGKFSSIFHLNLITSFHLFRIIFDFIFLYVLYIFISYFQKDNKLKKFTFIFISITSGFGGYLVALGIINAKVFQLTENLPVDLWVPESIPFWTMYGINLFSISLTLILLTYLFYLKATTENNYKYTLLSGFFLSLLLFIHPYNILTIISIISTHSFYLLWKKKKVLKHLFVIIFFASLAIIYQLYFLYLNPIFKNWASYPRYSPSLYNYFLGFGVAFLFGVIAFKRKLQNLKNIKELEIFLFFWIFINFLMLYFPISFQRRVVEGLYIPLSLIAMPEIFDFASFLSLKIKTEQTKILRIIIIFFTFSNMAVLATEIKTLTIKQFPYYLSKEILETFNFIENKTSKNSVFLSSYPVANFIPAKTGKIVYSGHYDQTLFFNKKKEKVKRFFAKNKDCKWKFNFLKKYKINYLVQEKEKYIFYSPAEYTKNNFANRCSFFKSVFENKKYQILKTKKE